jgi:Raf kinase inhibitor-like YbhB/YbcL family protein
MQFSDPISPAIQTGNLAAIMFRILVLIALLLAPPFFAGCRRNDLVPEPVARAGTEPNATLNLSSSSLENGQFPKEFTCDGEDSSPALAWSPPPAKTKSLVLTVTDPDARTFTHWALYNLPANLSQLPANVPKQDQLSDGSRQGRNDFDRIGYAGPCGPHGSTHRYFFDLFALDSSLDLPAGATRAQIEDAMNTHVLARGKLMARYSR